jgi:FixJ family two-component response regulator
MKRPIAHVTIHDPACRTAVVDMLHRRGWAVVEQPTGLHLIHAISGIILGDDPWLQPGLIVADAAARGCSGESIAHGLRDLGVHIPVVVIASRDPFDAIDRVARHVPMPWQESPRRHATA